MHHFSYKHGVLHAEDVSLPAIAEAVGTPFYCYSTATLTRHYEVFTGALHGLDALVCYAVKANSNVAVIRTLAALGAGADVVSVGELKRALAAGVPPERIVFSGVGKERAEMVAALEIGIHQFNVESEPELELLSEVASAMGKLAPIAIRINPDVDAKTHAKISTGKKENKFGIPWERARSIYGRAAQLPGIKVVGADVHIGSQLTDLAPFREAFSRVAELVRDLRADGHDIRRLDLGGGLGIPYEQDSPPPPHPDRYGEVIRDVVGDLDCEIILEPGRLLVGNAGVLMSKVIYVKEGEARKFVILDAAMNDLIRPSLYDAHHDIIPVTEYPADAHLMLADIVGPVCETGDVFGKARLVPDLAAGDCVAILSAGAYGAVMASTYNTRPLIPEVLVHGDRFAVVRRRVTAEDLIALEDKPDWQ
ncbi:diaminopimelate decarboxylase [Govanella unica]|uniref:Diaminopimelate decarboxylase n=1 Tax=Govanella unica TaxID=2975056 RepID=A0A9X3TVS0_9PROT|nr:diaminopimelate decarboxylase [Govania unica]MDA5192597.1 diaminopimelate decarboxylase [Govania unica]